MSTLYIIGSYDDEDHFCKEGYVTTKEDAEKLVDFLNKEWEELRVISGDISDKISDFEATLPPLVYEKALDVPKWKAGLSKADITPEMQYERGEAKLYNDEVHKRNSDMHHAHYTKIVELFNTLASQANQNNYFIKTGTLTSYSFHNYKRKFDYHAVVSLSHVVETIGGMI